MSVFNHHDGVSGTAKQHVANDYVKIVDKALTAAEQRSAEIVRRMALRESKELTPELFMCRQANESVCAVTQSMSRVGERAAVVVYNPLARSTSQHVAAFLSEQAVKIGVTVMLNGAAVYAEILPSVPSVAPDAAPYTLHFTAEDVPALSTKSYELRVGPSADKAKVLEGSVWAPGQSLQVSNDRFTVQFNSDTGRLKSITRRENGAETTVEVTNDIMYYTSFGSPGHEGYKYPKPDNRDHVSKHNDPAHHVGAVSGQNSGAYIFRPVDADQEAYTVRDTDALLQVVSFSGREVSEVRQQFSSWASSVVRIHRSSIGIDVDFTIGPVPIDDRMGKEVIYRFDSNVNSGDTFFTDANAREFMPRVKDYRPTWDVEVYEPVAGNYYPVNAASYVKDQVSGVQLSVLTDRSQGAASLESGMLGNVHSSFGSYVFSYSCCLINLRSA